MGFTPTELSSRKKKIPKTRIATLPKPSIGLGDLIAKVATPIARFLRLPCIDKKTNELKPESPCQKRKEALNKIRAT